MSASEEVADASSSASSSLESSSAPSSPEPQESSSSSSSDSSSAPEPEESSSSSSSSSAAAEILQAIAQALASSSSSPPNSSDDSSSPPNSSSSSEDDDTPPRNEGLLPRIFDTPPPQSEIAPECCLCYDAEKPILQDEEGNWINITEYPAQVPDNVLFLGPCRRHLTCKECLVMVLSNAQPHFLNPQRIRVPCLAAGQACTNIVGSQFFFTDAEIAKLVPEAIYQRYLEEVERYSLPGFELVACPGCGSRVPIPSGEIASRPFGSAVFTCTQNRNCNASFCYHCQRMLPPNPHPGSSRRTCDMCSGYDNGQHPKSLNHYFYKPERKSDDRSPALWRNEELTLELVLSQLKELVVIQHNKFMEHGSASNNLHALRCFNCLEGFIKSQDCNSVEHCGIYHCYICNYSASSRHQGIPANHWTGAAGCPRFDNPDTWRTILKMPFPCKSGTCYGHELGECSVEAHKPALKALNSWRRNRQVTKAFQSLLPEMQTKVREFLAERPAGYVMLKKLIDKL